MLRAKPALSRLCAKSRESAELAGNMLKVHFRQKVHFRHFWRPNRETRETCESWFRSFRPCTTHDASQTRQVATLCEKSRHDMSGWNHMWTCSAQVRDSRCDMCARSAHMCTTDSCNPAESCLHVHVRYMHGTCTQHTSCQRQTRTLHTSCNFW